MAANRFARHLWGSTWRAALQLVSLGRAKPERRASLCGNLAALGCASVAAAAAILAQVREARPEVPEGGIVLGTFALDNTVPYTPLRCLEDVSGARRPTAVNAYGGVDILYTANSPEALSIMLVTMQVRNEDCNEISRHVAALMPGGAIPISDPSLLRLRLRGDVKANIRTTANALIVSMRSENPATVEAMKSLGELWNAQGRIAEQLVRARPEIIQGLNLLVSENVRLGLQTHEKGLSIRVSSEDAQTAGRLRTELPAYLEPLRTWVRQYEEYEAAKQEVLQKLKGQ